MNKYYSTAEIAEKTGMVVSSIIRRAKREDWPFRTRAASGGGKEYAFNTLPESIQTVILKHEAENTDNLPTSHQGPSLENLNEKKRTVALARADLLQLYSDWLSRSKHGKKADARENFIIAYKGGAWSRILEILGPNVSWKTLERWKVQLRKQKSVVALADGRGGTNTDRAKMTERHLEVVLRAVLNPNKPTISSALKMARITMEAVGMDFIPSDKTMRRWLEKWKETNFGSWVFTREGKKAWNDKAAFFIERDYSLIEVGDIMVADGHVLNFETINPWTGKAKRMELVMWYDMASNCPLGWEIMPTENTQAIASAFRRACVTLGKYPKIAYLDNGRAFRSKYFNGVDFKQTGIGGLFQDLGVNTIFAWPYHGQSKVIERFFGTLHQLEMWVPSYVGNSIGNKPPRMNRGENQHRKAYEALGGRPLTLEETHIAVAQWIDRYINTPQTDKSHLKGKCPAEIMLAGRGPGIDEQRLRHLMMVKKIAQLSREGIKLFGNRYYAPELYSRTHSVEVRYDINDLSRIHVYRDGQFICTAPMQPKVHPAADLLGDESHKVEFKTQVTYRKQQEKDAASYTQQVLEDALSDHAQRLNELKKAASPKSVAESAPKPLSKAKITSIESAKARAEKALKDAPSYISPAEKTEILTELEKYEYLFTVSERDGIALREADQDWMEYFENTDEYNDIKARCEQRKKFYARKKRAVN